MCGNYVKWGYVGDSGRSMKSVWGLYCSANPLSDKKFNRLQQTYKVNDLSGLN